MYYYILERDGQYQVVRCVENNDPLHGHGSWSMHSGPYYANDVADAILSLILATS